MQAAKAAEAAGAKEAMHLIGACSLEQQRLSKQWRPPVRRGLPKQQRLLGQWRLPEQWRLSKGRGLPKQQRLLERWRLP